MKEEIQEGISVEESQEGVLVKGILLGEIQWMNLLRKNVMEWRL